MASVRIVYRVWAAFVLCIPLVTALPCIDELFTQRSQSPVLYGVPKAIYYPDWDPKTPTDTEHQAVINRSFNDALELVKLGAKATKDWRTAHRLVGQYFGDLDQSQLEAVHEVFTSILDPLGNGASDLLANVYITKKDVSTGMCNTASAYLAYSNAQPPYSQIHICEPDGYQRSELHYKSKTCAQLGGTVNRDAMDTMARLLLHEYIHHPPVGVTNIGIRSVIEDKKVDYNGKKVGAYGPYLTRKLAGDSIVDAMANSDNYAWLVQEIYWETTCKHTFNPPPPPELILHAMNECL